MTQVVIACPTSSQLYENPPSLVQAPRTTGAAASRRRPTTSRTTLVSVLCLCRASSLGWRVGYSSGL